MKSKQKRLLGLAIAAVTILTLVAVSVGFTSCSSSTTTSSTVPVTTQTTSSTAAVTTPTTSSTAPATTSTTSSVAPAKTLKVGVLADLSGFLSVFYLEASHDLQLTADYINEHGGVTVQGQNYNIQLIIRDSKSSPDGALAAANQLIFQDQVKYVIGPIAFEAAATTPLFIQNNIMDILNSTTTSPKEMGPTTPYTFAGDDSTVDEGILEAKIAQKEFPNAKTYVIVLPDDGTAPNVVPKLAPIYQSMGLTALNNGQAILFPNDMQDFSPIVSKLNSINPEIIFQPATPPPAVYGILKGIRSLGMSSVLISTLFPGDMNNVIKAVGVDAATNFACTNYTPNDPNNPPILQALINKLPPNTPFFTFTLGNCLMDLTNVMQQANSLDVAAIASKWESLDTIDSVYGTGYVGGDKTYGLHHHSVTFAVPYNMLMNGKVVNITGSDWINPGPTP